MKVNIDLKCEICTEQYNLYSHLPKILTQCGHTICKACLIHQITQTRENLKNSKNWLLKCPFDQKYQIINRKTTCDDFPKNFVLCEILEKSQNEENRKFGSYGENGKFENFEKNGKIGKFKNFEKNGKNGKTENEFIHEKEKNHFLSHIEEFTKKKFLEDFGIKLDKEKLARQISWEKKQLLKKNENFEKFCFEKKEKKIFGKKIEKKIFEPKKNFYRKNPKNEFVYKSNFSKNVINPKNTNYKIINSNYKILNPKLSNSKKIEKKLIFENPKISNLKKIENKKILENSKISRFSNFYDFKKKNNLPIRKKIYLDKNFSNNDNYKNFENKNFLGNFPNEKKLTKNNSSVFLNNYKKPIFRNSCFFQNSDFLKKNDFDKKRGNLKFSRYNYQSEKKIDYPKYPN